MKPWSPEWKRCEDIDTPHNWCWDGVPIGEPEYCLDCPAFPGWWCDGKPDPRSLLPPGVVLNVWKTREQLERFYPSRGPAGDTSTG